MARAKDLAGLAALGFLGYKLSQQGKGEDSNPTRAARPESTETREEPRRKIEDYQKKAPLDDTDKYPSGVMGGARLASKSTSKDRTTSSTDEKAPATAESPAAPSTRATPGGNEKRTEGSKPMPSLRAVERKVAARQASMSTDAMKNASRAQGRRANLAPIDQIPGQDRSGPIGGERVSGTELGRNVSNTLAALTPLGGGVGKVGAELATSGRAQRAYNAAQAERRAAEGMSPAEALAAKKAAEQAAREAKTLNPNAWLAGPKGMAENFRKGGAVKKMASGGMTASRRADGIATRGKTKCKMY